VADKVPVHHTSASWIHVPVISLICHWSRLPLLHADGEVTHDNYCVMLQLLAGINYLVLNIPRDPRSWATDFPACAVGTTAASSAHGWRQNLRRAPHRLVAT
jgi:hypothetical protein